MAVKRSEFKIVILLMLMFTWIAETGGSISMCNTGTYTATNYQLSRLDSDPSNCKCLLTSTTQTTSTKVKFDIVSFTGCRQKLGFHFDNKQNFISCDSSPSLYYSIGSPVIELKLEPFMENQSETTFILKITTQPETNLSLTCFQPTVDTPSTLLPTKNMYPPSRDTELISKSTTQSQTTRTTSSDEKTVLNNEQAGNEQTIGIAIGCFIGGIICGVIAVLGFLWFRKKRQKDALYSTPASGNRDVHTYDSIVPGTGVQNSNTEQETTPTPNITPKEANTAPNTVDGNSTTNTSVIYNNATNNTYLEVL